MVLNKARGGGQEVTEHTLVSHSLAEGVLGAVNLFISSDVMESVLSGFKRTVHDLIPPTGGLVDCSS